MLRSVYKAYSLKRCKGEKNRGKSLFIQDIDLQKGGKRSLFRSVAERDTHALTNKQDGGYYRIVNALKVAAEENAVSFVFPGHNGGEAAPLSMTQLIGEQPFAADLAEIDNLGNPKGPILEAQKQAAEVFGASKTWFLVGGTTCGVHAAMMASCSPRNTLILPRNSHKSAIAAMVFTGLVPKYIVPDYDFDWDIPTAVTPFQVKKAIKELELEGLKPGAIFITSPTYYGICSNIKEISDLCHLHDIPLIVDEAHGAHFGFHPCLPSSALQKGADVVVQSTHKVLFSLTQSSMLHVSGNRVDPEKISFCLQNLQTTSPSSLLLASLDATATQLRENPKTIFHTLINLATEAKNTLKQIPGISVFSSPYTMDPLRVTVGVYELGLSRYEVDDFLYNNQKVIAELSGSRSVTFPFTLGTRREHVERLIMGFKHVSSFNKHNPPSNKGFATAYVDFMSLNDVNMQLTPREAFFAKKKTVDMQEAIGKICGELIYKYPPGIPIVTPGEVISERVVQMLLQSKNDGARVVGAHDPLLSSILICDF